MMTLKSIQSPEPDLTNRAMLVSLNISVWTARRADKRITQEVAYKHGADAAMLTNSKYLVSKTAMLDINAVASAARQDHYELSLPWANGGSNIMSGSAYAEYAKRMRAHDTKFWQAVREFSQEYDQLKINAERSLGSLFNPAEYPADIRSKFAFGFSIFPLPAANDFRVDLGNAELTRVKADIEKTVQDATRAAMATVYQRVATVVGAMIERLKIYQPDQPGAAPFRDSLVSNVAELVQMLPLLNVTGDPALAKIADQMSAELCRYDATELRASEPARELTSKAAERILSAISDYI